MRSLLFGVLAFAAAASAAPVSAQTTDVMPPEVVAFTFSPMSIDVSTGSQMVTVTMRITDDLSGTTFASVRFLHQGTLQSRFAGAFRTAGTSLDGTYTAVATIPQFAADGTWTASITALGDAAGNNTTVSTAVLQSRGFPTDLMVTSVPDTQAPQIAALSMSPATVDVSGGDQTVTFSLDLTDDLSGAAFTTCSVAGFVVSVLSPSGVQNQLAAASSFALVSGTSLSGRWDGSLEMPQYSEAGTWQIQSVLVRDCAGNQNFLATAQLAGLGLTTTFDVVSSPEDVQPPDLTDLSYVPIAINTSTGSQTVTVRLTIADDLAGVAFTPTTSSVSFFEAGVQFGSPSGNQSQAAAFFSLFTLISGTPLNGVWESTIPFPQFSEDGTWNVNLIQVKDSARNIRSYNTAALRALGLPTELEVIRPSLDSDGAIGAGGGTVEDDTFGPRASVTLPPGAVALSTDIAIDVFPNPLAIPTPEGFQGPGTLFVNIELTPTPAFPLAPPGMQIVLPLPNPLPAGTVLSLYKVDTATGLLVPAIDVFGSPAVGSVDTNGLSATFPGVASLSTVVGLLTAAASDTTPPVIVCAQADGIWHAANVSLTCTAVDADSGLANPGDASLLLSTNVGSGEEQSNAFTDSRQVCDVAGNCATAGPIGGNMVDRRAPHVTPPPDQTAVQTQPGGAIVSYPAAVVTEGGSGLASSGCVPATGSLFPVGVTTVNCTAADLVGNTGTATFLVTVTPMSPGGADGQMIGAGYIAKGGTHHHFVFRVLQSENRHDGRLDYLVRLRNHFESTAIASVVFSNDPAFQPGRGSAPPPSVDSVSFRGTGKWNGKAGYSFEATATDRGEPGRRRDTFSLVIRDTAGNVVAEINDTLDAGNIQSTRLRR